MTEAPMPYTQDQLNTPIVVSFLCALAIIPLIYGQFYFVEISVAWMLIALHFILGFAIRRRAMGKDTTSFFKVVLGWNGVKTAVLLIVVGLAIASNVFAIAPFVTSIFIVYVVCTAFELINLYLYHSKQS